MTAEKYKAEKTLEGYEMIGCDVINIGSKDFAAGLPFLRSLEDSTSIPFISANIIDNATGELCFDPYVLLEKAPFTVGVIGVTKFLPPTEKDVRVTDYFTAGNTYINELKEKADIIIMLVTADRRDRAKVIKEFPKADYIFLSRDLSKVHDKDMREATPFLFTSNKQGKYLSVVDLTIADVDSPIVDVTKMAKKIETMGRRLENYQKMDPDKTMEELYADKPAKLKQIQDIQKEKFDTETSIKLVPNRSAYKSVSMNKNVGEDDEMLKFVKKSLEEYVKRGGPANNKNKSSAKKRPPKLPVKRPK